MNAEQIMTGIDGELQRLSELLAPLADGLAAAASGGPVEREDLATLREPIAHVLSAAEGTVGGSGVITAPGVLADAEYWMEWWWVLPGRAPEPLRVNLEPSAPDFFDYTTADWFAVPQATGGPHIAGPYVDFVCTNEYAMTFARPVLVADRFVGVAALDITVSGFERLVLPALRSLNRPVALVNASGRVIASSSSEVWPGQALREARSPLAPASDFGWTLVPV